MLAHKIPLQTSNALSLPPKTPCRTPSPHQLYTNSTPTLHQTRQSFHYHPSAPAPRSTAARAKHVCVVASFAKKSTPMPQRSAFSLRTHHHRVVPLPIHHSSIKPLALHSAFDRTYTSPYKRSLRPNMLSRRTSPLQHALHSCATSVATTIPRLQNRIQKPRIHVFHSSRGRRRIRTPYLHTQLRIANVHSSPSQLLTPYKHLRFA